MGAKARVIYLGLFALAFCLQVVWYGLLISLGFSNGSFLQIALTLFPGSIAWALPFGFVWMNLRSVSRVVEANSQDS